MANYTELATLEELSGAAALRNKIKVAMAVKARAIATAPSPTPEARAWAMSALQNPQQYEAVILRFIGVTYGLAAPLGQPQAGLTLAQITGASDADVQTAVNSAVDTLLGA